MITKMIMITVETGMGPMLPFPSFVNQALLSLSSTNLPLVHMSAAACSTFIIPRVTIMEFSLRYPTRYPLRIPEAHPTRMVMIIAGTGPILSCREIHTTLHRDNSEPTDKSKLPPMIT